MSKYTTLTEWLVRQPGDSVTLTFAEVEEIIGGDLPHVARRYVKWWDNTPDTVEHDARVKAGWKIVMIDLERKRIKFQRI